MPFEITPNVNVQQDEEGVVRQLEHLQEPFVVESNADFADAELTARDVAATYLREVAPIYGINADLIAGAEESLTDAAPSDDGGEQIRLAEEKPVMGVTTLSYVQMYRGIPVWEGGLNVTVQEAPMRVTSSQSSVHLDMRAEESELLDEEQAYVAERIDEQLLRALLGSPNYEIERINERRRLFYYRYDPEQRYDPEIRTPEESDLQHGPPTLPLPPVPETIVPGVHYKVTEVLFTMPIEGWGEINWSAFVEARTGAVLRLRALVACVATGTIFRFDPFTTTGDPSITPGSADSVLDPLRATINLEGLRPPLNPASPQALDGEFVRLLDVGPPAISAPTEPLPGRFAYSVRTDNFAAVNAYHHCDGLFRMMQGMGFDIRSYFDGTDFPVRVDHRALGTAVNAQAPGNATSTGSDGFRFALAASGQPVGIAADVRVVLHEFGHTLLWDNVHSPNFGFAHSAGDSLAAILSDPQSALRTDASRRFLTFPWVLGNRRHDRAISAGWAWGGVNDVGGYESEQILSTTLFRLYRSMGGDDPHRNVRDASARYAAFLIIRAIGLLSSGTITPTPRPDVYATKLMEADTGTRSFEGRPGGTLHKVIRWSFEKQGLYQPSGTPLPIRREGAPPQVDVYINDGRNGQYEFKENVWNNGDIWNRTAPDGGLTHQPAVGGAVNYAYVRVKNRGTRRADGVIVRGYLARLATGLVWPDDWQPMTTAQLPVAGGIAAGGETIVGPFEWRPPSAGQASLLMSVSAAGDLSNIDANSFLPCATGPTPEWLLIPFDNNLGRRNVTVIPGTGLDEAFRDGQFEVRNSSANDALIELKAVFPDFLAERKWGLHFDNPGGASFTLGPGRSRSIFFRVEAGDGPGTAVNNEGTNAANVEIQTYINGALAGVVAYDISQSLQPQSSRLADAFASPSSDKLTPLLSRLNVSSDQISSVKLRRVSVDIDLNME